MTPLDVLSSLSLHVADRISEADAERQHATAAEILRRLECQPGLILADEVGMGKTFIALAVAVAKQLSDPRQRPVVVMVPPALRDKWPRDFAVFRSCQSADVAARLKHAVAESATDFFKLLDDAPHRRAAVIFLTHGALLRAVRDPWIHALIIQRALYRRKDTLPLRRALGRFMGTLLRAQRIDRREGLWETLLDLHPTKWKGRLQKEGVLSEEDDDPAPEMLVKFLDSGKNLKLDALYDELRQSVPLRASSHVDEHLREAGPAIRKAIAPVWQEFLKGLELDLPLLIFDEAHHLKNANTRTSSLFDSEESREDADQMTRGALAGAFEKMVFLTATPFQLGHHELCEVLRRFAGVRDPAATARPAHMESVAGLQAKLDRAQEAALRFDAAWGRLCPMDLSISGEALDLDTWWARAARPGTDGLTPAALSAVRVYHELSEKMHAAQEAIFPWVIRHEKPRTFVQAPMVSRRQHRVGAQIAGAAHGDEGLPIGKEERLPFLLAARAVATSPASRPVFAEGLSSSWAAFLDTRRQLVARDGKAPAGMALDEDEEPAPSQDDNAMARWYVDRIRDALPAGGREWDHPKVAATVHKTIELWKRGEKVLVFCHYIATGRTLRTAISSALRAEISAAVAAAGAPTGDPFAWLDLRGEAFEREGPVRRAAEEHLGAMIDRFPALDRQRADIVRVSRRFLRTPSFLVRFTDLSAPISIEALAAVFKPEADNGTVPFGRVLEDFLRFLLTRTDDQEQGAISERQAYLDALENIQTGSFLGKDVRQSFDEKELQGSAPDTLMPNVRLCNGQVPADVRRRLMLTFNTPFFPEIMIASSVMAEGVDLHLHCQHIIHHDLCWNPSMLEQRTGRVDRIGCQGERRGTSVEVFLPYLAGTQDERMYRVVSDREKWFRIVMGSEQRTDFATTERLADRIPLPDAAVEGLRFRLNVV